MTTSRKSYEGQKSPPIDESMNDKSESNNGRRNTTSSSNSQNNSGNNNPNNRAYFSAQRVYTEMFRQSKVVNSRMVDEVVLLNCEDILLGDLLGSGEFCHVVQVHRIDLQNKNPGGSTKNPYPYESNVNSTNNTMTKTSTRYESMIQRASLPDQYAIKFLRNDLSPDKYSVGAAELIAELLFLSSLEHPNIITVHGVSHDGPKGFLQNGSGFFIIIDRLHVTLTQQIDVWRNDMRRRRRRQKDSTPRSASSRPFSNASSFDIITLKSIIERLKVAIDITSALSYLHSKNILYRSIDPNNFAFNDTGKVVLFDMGLARELTTIPLCNDGKNYDLSGNKGNIQYMAPEVCCCQPYGLGADVYSVAVLIWQLISLASIPYPGITTSEEYKERIIAQKERPMMDPAWTDTLRFVLQSSWTTESSDRPPMKHLYRNLQNELEYYMQQLSSSSSSSSLPSASLSDMGSSSEFMTPQTTKIGMSTTMTSSLSSSQLQRPTKNVMATNISNQATGNVVSSQSSKQGLSTPNNTMANTSNRSLEDKLHLVKSAFQMMPPPSSQCSKISFLTQTSDSTMTTAASTATMEDEFNSRRDEEMERTLGDDKKDSMLYNNPHYNRSLSIFSMATLNMSNTSRFNEEPNPKLSISKNQDFKSSPATKEESTKKSISIKQRIRNHMEEYDSRRRQRHRSKSRNTRSTSQLRGSEDNCMGNHSSKQHRSRSSSLIRRRRHHHQDGDITHTTNDALTSMSSHSNHHIRKPEDTWNNDNSSNRNVNSNKSKNSKGVNDPLTSMSSHSNHHIRKPEDARNNDNNSNRHVNSHKSTNSKGFLRRDKSRGRGDGIASSESSRPKASQSSPTVTWNDTSPKARTAATNVNSGAKGNKVTQAINNSPFEKKKMTMMNASDNHSRKQVQHLNHHSSKGSAVPSMSPLVPIQSSPPIWTSSVVATPSSRDGWKTSLFLDTERSTTPPFPMTTNARRSGGAA